MSPRFRRFLFILFIVGMISGFVGFVFSWTVARFSVLQVLSRVMPQNQLISNFNVLVVGLDHTGGTPRTDTMLVVNLNPRMQNIGVISIPRDTRVYIKDHGMDKINHAYARGGIELARDTAANFLGIPIPYYIELHMDGVAEIVDEVGGVRVDVEKRMHYVDRAGDLYIDLKPGVQKLNGKKAVEYLRYRADGMGDIGRISRQQNFLRAFVERVKGFTVFFKAPVLVRQISSHVKTNMPLSTLLSMAVKMREAYDLGRIDVDTVPGESILIDAISYYDPKLNDTKTLVNRVIRGYVEKDSSYFTEKSTLRIEVLNGNGDPSKARQMAELLEAQGYKVSKTGNAGHFNYPKTLVVNWKGYKLAPKANHLLADLSLPTGRLVDKYNPKKKIDFTVVVGHDLR